MPTVHEVLKQSGFTDDEIANLGQKKLDAFGTMVTSAENDKKAGLDAVARAETEKAAAAAAFQKAETERQAAVAAQQAAELAQRSNVEFYETKITPALTGWEQKQKELEIRAANAESKTAFYESQIQGAKAAGCIPMETPAFVLPTPQPGVNQPRDNEGRFVAGAPGSVPGSPTFFDPNQIAGRIGDVAGTLQDLNWKYQTLFEGRPLPVPPSQLIAEADAQKLPLMDYAARKFNFAQREQELAAKADAENRAKISAEAVAPFQKQIEEERAKSAEALKAKDREWAEKIGNNPEVRIAQPSRFADVSRAVKANERPDPLNLNDQQRRQATSSAIRQEITTNAAA